MSGIFAAVNPKSAATASWATAPTCCPSEAQSSATNLRTLSELDEEDCAQRIRQADYTYGRLLEKPSPWAATPPGPSHAIYSATLNLDRAASRADFDGLSVEIATNPKRAVIFDAEFNVVETDRGLVFGLQLQRRPG